MVKQAQTEKAPLIRLVKKTIQIALQSIMWGIGASVTGMVLAAFGLIPPLEWALLQEEIDVIVILTAPQTAHS